jgi:hypothetical protein
MVAMLATKDAGTTMVSFRTLKDGVANQIINAINFKEMKARTIEIILKNKAKSTQLTGTMEKGQLEVGEVNG